MNQKPKKKRGLIGENALKLAKGEEIKGSSELGAGRKTSIRHVKRGALGGELEGEGEACQSRVPTGKWLTATGILLHPASRDKNKSEEG